MAPRGAVRQDVAPYRAAAPGEKKICVDAPGSVIFAVETDLIRIQGGARRRVRTGSGPLADSRSQGTAVMLSSLPKNPRQLVDAGVSAERLMAFSEQRVALAANSGSAREAQIASRLLDDVGLYRRWEQFHGQLMHGVADARRPSAKVVELRRAAFSTLHRKAPFEYLRERHVTGGARQRLMEALFGVHDYAHCLVREHQAYLSCSASLMCADSLCGEMLGDAPFSAALAHYHSAYSEYFRAYGDSLLAERMSEEVPVKSLLPYLRYQLKTIREHMLSGAPRNSDFTALQALYEATGETQRLRALRHRP